MVPNQITNPEVNKTCFILSLYSFWDFTVNIFYGFDGFYWRVKTIHGNTICKFLSSQNVLNVINLKLHNQFYFFIYVFGVVLFFLKFLDYFRCGHQAKGIAQSFILIYNHAWNWFIILLFVRSVHSVSCWMNTT